MRNYRLYIISAMAWIILALIAVACSHSDSGGSSSTSSCTYVNGFCVATSGSTAYGGTVQTPPYPSTYNATITDSNSFANVNLALNGYESSYYCYGNLPIQMYTPQGYPETILESCNQLQVSIASVSTNQYLLYLTSPNLSSDASISYQNVYTSLNPWNSFGLLGTWYPTPSVTVAGQTGAGYIMQIMTNVYNGPLVQQLPILELDVLGSTSNSAMLFKLVYLGTAKQPAPILASGTLRKGIDYQ